jgi:hypothetical protein
MVRIRTKAPAFCSAVPGAPPQASPVRALWKSPEGSESVAVLVKESSTIKPTFLQVCCQPLCLKQACSSPYVFVVVRMSNAYSAPGLGHCLLCFSGFILVSVPKSVAMLVKASSFSKPTFLQVSPVMLSFLTLRTSLQPPFSLCGGERAMHRVAGYISKSKCHLSAFRNL